MSTPSGLASGRPRLLGVALTAGLAGLGWWLLTPDSSPSPEPESAQLAGVPAPPGLSATKFLNHAPGSHHVGTAACVECHQANHQSYLLTAHSQALDAVDIKDEPVDGSFTHEPSGRSYRVYRKDGELRHEELLRDAEGREIARSDWPVQIRVGSGHFCRTYLINVDGFLHESPITWYTSRGRWDMSPGYDFAQHWSFERPATQACLHCHSGRVEAIDQSVHRLKIHEQAIGCESCHGPGSVHVAKHQGTKGLSGEEDLTIVNPARLARRDSEAICAACHQSGQASVALRGREATEYLPGRPLTDYRIDYRFADQSSQMTVVGHMEQLRFSKCYQKSEELTCLTCHDPHARAKPADLVAFHRQKCLNCHADPGCKLPESQRKEQQPNDSCIACHMPRGDTDIPHVAFTHHRIGLHSKTTPKEADQPGELVPVDDDSHLSELDRRRNLGLAYLKLVNNVSHERHHETYRRRALDLLEAVYTAGLRDGLTCEALAELHWKKDQRRARAMAEEALRDAKLPPEQRAPAMLILADTSFEANNYSEAITTLEKLTTQRRLAEDWRLLGVSQLLHRQPEKARDSLRTALSIRPTRFDVHGALGEVYRALGDLPKARHHFATAEYLRQRHQQ